MKRIGRYLKEHGKNIGIYGGAVCLFLLVIYLYRLPVEAVLYALLLSAVWMIFWGILDFWQDGKKGEKRRQIGAALSSVCPSPELAQSQEEREYLELLGRLWEENKEQEAQMEIAKKESMDYYSLWAHQIKTPIAAMRVLLQEEAKEGQSERFIREMKQELFRTEQYVELVLSYLRIGDISGDLLLQWYPLEEMVKQAVRKYSQLFILQKIALHMEEMPASVLTDEKWLVFVLEQILSNALKYTREGSVSIYSRQQEDGQVELVVADTGIGIYEEDLPRVFERGFTGYNGREDKKATGIGLYLCKMVMDKLGHSIWITSVPGEGTQMHLGLGRKPLCAKE